MYLKLSTETTLERSIFFYCLLGLIVPSWLERCWLSSVENYFTN